MKTYFVSDAHLGSLAFPNGKENEYKLVRWLNTIKPDCEALYLVGDLIDFWYEYKRVVPKGYVRFLGKLAEFTDDGIPVYWFIGNHDIWLFDYVQQELGIKVLKGIHEINLYSQPILIAHGDGLGDPSIQFAILRSIFHNKVCQAMFRLIHPDMGMSFGLNWAKHSRLKRENNPENYLGETKEHLVLFAKEHMVRKGQDAPALYIFGHRHIMLDLSISKTSRVIILGDWFNHFSYGEMDDQGFNLAVFEE